MPQPCPQHLRRGARVPHYLLEMGTAGNVMVYGYGIMEWFIEFSFMMIMGFHIMISWLYGFYGMGYNLQGMGNFMWVKQCHTPPMAGNGNHTTCKNGDDWVMVYYCFTHINCETHANNGTYGGIKKNARYIIEY